MADKTVNDLANEVGELLRIIGPGDPLDAADDAAIQAKYSSVFERLQDRELAYWAEGAIPELVFDAVAHVVTGEMSPKYWRGNQPLMQEFGAFFQRGMGELQDIAEQKFNGEPIKAEYF